MAGRTSSNDGDASGNQGLDDFWVVKLSSGPTNITENSKLIGKAVVGPNPTNGEVLITLPKTDKGQILVFDAAGKVVQSSLFTGANTTLNLFDLPKGLYTVLIKGENGTWEERVIKQ